MEGAFTGDADQAAASLTRETGADALRPRRCPAAKVKAAYVDDDQSHTLACDDGRWGGKPVASKGSPWYALVSLCCVLQGLEFDDAQRRVEAVSLISKGSRRIESLRWCLFGAQQVLRAVE